MEFTEIELIVAIHIENGTIDTPGSIIWSPASAVEDARRKFEANPELLQEAITKHKQQYNH